MYDPDKKYNKYLLRCEKCGHPIVFDQDWFAREKARLADEIISIDIQLSQNKTDAAWRLRAKTKKKHLIKQCADLKVAVHAANTHKNMDKNRLFMELAREALGDGRYHELLEQAGEMLLHNTGKVMTERKAVEYKKVK